MTELCLCQNVAVSYPRGLSLSSLQSCKINVAGFALEWVGNMLMEQDLLARF